MEKLWRIGEYRDIELVTTERRRNYLLSEPNFYTTKFVTEKLLEIEMKKTQILMNTPVYLGFSILELSKILMYELWYDHVKPKKQKSKTLLYGYRHLYCSCKNR